MELQYLIEHIALKLQETATLLYLHGPTACGKSYFGAYLAHLFGPAVFTDQKQFLNDTLVFDDACKKQARCIYMDEFGSFTRMEDDAEFARIVKKVLCGVATEPRTCKTGKSINSIMYIDLVIVTSNFSPTQFNWFSDKAVQRRMMIIYVNERIERFNWIDKTKEVEETYKILFYKINLMRASKINDYLALCDFNNKFKGIP